MNIQELKIKHDYIEGPRRLYCGGSWSSGSDNGRAAWSRINYPGILSNDFGFRLLLKVPS